MTEEIKKQLITEADKYKDRLVSLVSKLTQFDSFIGDEKEIAYFIKDELNKIGLEVHIN